jgi:hypothetical protein
MVIGINGKIGSGKDTVGSIIQYLTSSEYKEGWRNYNNWLEVVDNTPLYNDWEIKKFANKLKDMVCILIGCTRKILENHDFKNTPLGEEWNKLKITYSDGYDKIVDFFPYNFDINKLEDVKGKRAYIHNIETVQLTPRLLMQLLGTECGRNIIHPDIWVNSLFNGYKLSKDSIVHKNKNNQYYDKAEYPNWIITDLRFPNEFDKIKKHGGITINVVRDKSSKDVEDQKLNKTKDFGITSHYSEIALDGYIFDFYIENNGTVEELKNQIENNSELIKIIYQYGK